MIFLSNTLASPQENLAYDEALVEVADRYSLELGEKSSCTEVLRLWELPLTCVVLGRASRYDQEVNELACARDSIPVLRRVSGGASIVAGPGCLMYSLLISYDARPTWRMLDVAHQQVMTRIQQAVQNTLQAFHRPEQVLLEGTCDLTIDHRKFSGNALRCKRHWMLYHGTLLTTMPLHWVTDYLAHPPRQPEYRQNRSHDSFITRLVENDNLGCGVAFQDRLEAELATVWEAQSDQGDRAWLSDVDTEAIKLLHDRYSRPEWNR